MLGGCGANLAREALTAPWSDSDVMGSDSLDLPSDPISGSQELWPSDLREGFMSDRNRGTQAFQSLQSMALPPSPPLSWLAS